MIPTDNSIDVTVIGAGPAGLAAAIYTGRSQLSPLLITGNALGGQAATTSEVENYPGFPNGINGAELTRLMQQQAERFGTRVEIDEVVELDQWREEEEKVLQEKISLCHDMIISFAVNGIEKTMNDFNNR